MILIKRLFAFITGRRVVWLEDFQNEIHTSVAKIGYSGELEADFYWPFSIRRCILDDDGVVRQVSGNYVRRWGYVAPLFDWPWLHCVE